MLTDKTRLETLITFYFGSHDSYELAGIRRAFRDFNRTWPIENKTQEQRKILVKEIETFLVHALTTLIHKPLNSQVEFDNAHQSLSQEMKSKWPELKIGHIQKWINMSLKYWLIFGDSYIKDISQNASFFHIPIDSIVLAKLFNESKPAVPWSKIETYDSYFAYQQKFRILHPNVIPIVFETEGFMGWLNESKK